MELHCGIDFGAKNAGTTAICYQEGDQVVVKQSIKNSDADRFLKDEIYLIKPSKIFIDAPLSLPKAFFDKGSDYSHRQCDRSLNGMSPMFLGGLTARAIALKKHLNDSGVTVLEAYPKALIQHTQLTSHYKKDLGKFLSEFKDKFFINCDIKITSWHQADALLAWYSGFRYMNNRHQTYGDPDEGLIIV